MKMEDIKSINHFIMQLHSWISIYLCKKIKYEVNSESYFFSNVVHANKRCIFQNDEYPRSIFFPLFTSEQGSCEMGYGEMESGLQR